MTTPLALQLYEQYLKGKSISELSAELEIPADRVVQRIRVAAEYVENRKNLRILSNVA